MKKTAPVFCRLLFLLVVFVAAQVQAAVPPAADTPNKAVAVASPAAPGNPASGEALFKSRCATCHSMAQNKVGPRLSGVVGRPAGALPDYNYSLALKKSGLIWDAATLDRWLANPPALVSGTKMLLKLDNIQDRADLTAYLKTMPAAPK
jgi:cytochrome c